MPHVDVKRGSTAASLAGLRSGGMTQSRSRVFLRTIRCVAADVLRFASSPLRSHAQLAAENLFLRKQLALYSNGRSSRGGPTTQRG